MTILTFTLLMLATSTLAGLIGALTGLGGGLIVIPVLVLFFHVNMHYALAAGLFAVMATSMGTAVAYLREGYINIRLGMFLEIAAAIGAIIGAYISTSLSAKIVQIIFGLVFIALAYLSWRKHEEAHPLPKQSSLDHFLNLSGHYPTQEGLKPYAPQRIEAGFLSMVIAGIFSGLLGIGAGSLKVIAMDQIMQLPYKVSTSTSNFIIGITAAAGIGVFFKRGFVDPFIISPIVIGVFIGALLGARLMPKLKISFLRNIFNIIILLMALEMLYQALLGN